MALGYVALVLHAHLPFVRHAEKARAAEEVWFFQAISECYLPLLATLKRLADNSVPAPLTLSISPTLLTMFRDNLLCQRYDTHLSALATLIERQLVRSSDTEQMAILQFYQQRISALRKQWDDYNGNLAHQFRDLARRERLRLFTCAATHGYLPLLRHHPPAVRAQLAVGVDEHERYFGELPHGIWLPECGYFPDLDGYIAELGLRSYVTDAHAFAFANPPAICGNYAPIITAQYGLSAFARDRSATLEVWSRDQGYPGHPLYREYHRDLGYELPLEHLTPLVQEGDGQVQTGLKLFRVTGANRPKALYDPEAAAQQAAKDAHAFLRSRERQARETQEALGTALLGRPPLIVAPFDAELFGHWWYEGPIWIERLFRQVSLDESIEFIDLPTYLERHPAHQVVGPAESSWGEGGYHQYWLNEANDWIYAHLDRAAARMIRVASEHPDAVGSERLALNQAARELLLAQASDWAFIMRSATTVEYAVERTELHLRRLAKLFDQIESKAVDQDWLSRLTAVDPIFPEIDYRVFCRRSEHEAQHIPPSKGSAAPRFAGD